MAVRAPSGTRILAVVNRAAVRFMSDGNLKKKRKRRIGDCQRAAIRKEMWQAKRKNRVLTDEQTKTDQQISKFT